MITMQRWNPEGILKEKLIWVLSQRALVIKAKKENSCLLCKSPKVNEAALCQVCWALLNEEELKLANKWVDGTGP